ncbi:hypothetical protein PTKIN_Ptkin14bG0061200 [Pterospermum kingtungense]
MEALSGLSRYIVRAISPRMAAEPPFFEKYKAIIRRSAYEKEKCPMFEVFEELELPLIDLSHLNHGPFERQRCIEQMAQAASEWGFFQIVNHGIPQELLDRLKYEQMRVFQQPFEKKAEENFLNLSAHSYRWGNPLATSLRNLSWSEALHISLKDISKMDDCYNLRSTIEEYAAKAGLLAQTLAECLAQNLGIKPNYFLENCSPTSSSFRMNRYPPCPFTSMMLGFIPHSDTDFLTIVSQDQVGGLQLKRDGRWVNVKPNPQALVINIGDLYQALSNGIYKSIAHRVVASQEVERYSAAYFYCPTYETVIESCSKPSLYRNFSFKEFREQIEKDVKDTGDKVGLSRFLL